MPSEQRKSSSHQSTHKHLTHSLARSHLDLEGLLEPRPDGEVPSDCTINEYARNIQGMETLF